MSTVTKVEAVTLPSAVGRFVLHVVEMCVVMCLGGGLLDLAVFSAASALGYPDLVSRAPDLSIMVLAFNGALSMAAYMFLRQHPTQHTIEMSGSTIVGGLLWVGARWAGWVPASALANWGALFALICGPLCALMVVVMLARFEHYGGRIGAVVESDAAGGWTCPMHSEVRRSAPGQCPICGMTLRRRS